MLFSPSADGDDKELTVHAPEHHNAHRLASPARTGAERDRTLLCHRHAPSFTREGDAYLRRMLADLEQTRSEPGALQFHIHRDRADPQVFVIYEVWKDIHALRAHFETPYVRQFVADSAEYIDGDMTVQWLVMKSPYQQMK